MENQEELEKEVARRATARDRKKRKRMKVSGKSVFTLARLVAKSAGRSVIARSHKRSLRRQGSNLKARTSKQF